MGASIDLQTFLLLLGAILFGVLVTVLAQIASAVRQVSHEVTRTSRRMYDMVDELQPVATRLQRLSRIVEQSEPDLERVQLALRGFTDTISRATDSLGRVANVVAIAAPVAMAAVRRWSESSEPEGEPADPSKGNGAADGDSRDTAL